MGMESVPVAIKLFRGDREGMLYEDIKHFD